MPNLSQFPAARLVMSLALSLAALPGCSDSNDPQSDDPEVQAAIDEGEGSGAQISGQVDDELNGASDEQVISETAAIGAALDEGEIVQAQIAVDLASSSEVRDLAQMLIDDHSANMDDAENMLAERDMAPAENPISDQLASEAEDGAQALEDRPSENFDSVFLDMQVRAHAQARVVVDHFIDLVQDDEVSTFWQDTRDTIEDHLDQVMDLAARI